MSPPYWNTSSAAAQATWRWRSNVPYASSCETTIGASGNTKKTRCECQTISRSNANRIVDASSSRVQKSIRDRMLPTLDISSFLGIDSAALRRAPLRSAGIHYSGSDLTLCPATIDISVLAIILQSTATDRMVSAQLRQTSRQGSLIFRPLKPRQEAD